MNLGIDILPLGTSGELQEIIQFITAITTEIRNNRSDWRGTHVSVDLLSTLIEHIRETKIVICRHTILSESNQTVVWNDIPILAKYKILERIRRAPPRILVAPRNNICCGRVIDACKIVRTRDNTSWVRTVIIVVIKTFYITDIIHMGTETAVRISAQTTTKPCYTIRVDKRMDAVTVWVCFHSIIF